MTAYWRLSRGAAVGCYEVMVLQTCPIGSLEALAKVVHGLNPPALQLPLQHLISQVW